MAKALRPYILVAVCRPFVSQMPNAFLSEASDARREQGERCVLLDYASTRKPHAVNLEEPLADLSDYRSGRTSPLPIVCRYFTAIYCRRTALKHCGSFARNAFCPAPGIHALLSVSDARADLGQDIAFQAGIVTPHMASCYTACCPHEPFSFFLSM